MHTRPCSAHAGQYAFELGPRKGKAAMVLSELMYFNQSADFAISRAIYWYVQTRASARIQPSADDGYAVRFYVCREDTFCT